MQLFFVSISLLFCFFGTLLADEASPTSSPPKELPRKDIPPEQAALEAEIRAVQAQKDPFMMRIPEERLQKHLNKVTKMVLNSIIDASVLEMKLHLTSLDFTANLMLAARDSTLCRLGTDKEMIRVLKRLQQTNIGKESLMRVTYAITTVAPYLPLMVPASLKEIQQTAIQFAAQPLEKELMKEEAYRDALQAIKQPKNAQGKTQRP